MEKSKRREDFKKLQKENNKGITLVALVITIIILIILSTVTITAVLGDNGLIGQAKIARNLTEESIISENEKMNKLAQEYANLLAEESETPEPDLRSEIEKARDEETVFNTKTKLSDIHGNEVTVPAGFKIAKDTGLTVQQGVVIEDVNASTDSAVQGSQFVWIPVGKFTKDDGTESNEIILGRYTFADDAQGTPTLQQAAYTDENPENYKNSKVIEELYDEYSGPHRDGVPNSIYGINATANDLGAWIESVKENGGYYIGRYEASYASGSSVDNYKAATKVSEHNSTSSMSYNPGTLWNYITELEASKVAINTYEDSRSVKSDLMNSYAWDTAIVYIQECGHENYANQTSKNSSLANTGTNDDEICKINDLSSNMVEWSTEYSTTNNGTSAFPCTLRGGYYGSGSRSPSYRGAGNSYSGYFEGGGFRICLYL